MTRWYRAPELLCEADYYGTGVDVWSVGCIFAEILGRKPLFRVSSTADQLKLVIEKLGSPTDDELSQIHGDDVLKQIRSMPFQPKVCCVCVCDCDREDAPPLPPTPRLNRACFHPPRS